MVGVTSRRGARATGSRAAVLATGLIAAGALVASLVAAWALGVPDGRVRWLGPGEWARLGAWFGPDLVLDDHGRFGVERTGLAGLSLRPTSLVVRYPAGSASNLAHETDGTPLGGAQAYLPLVDGPADDLHLRYCLRFADGFDFARGGKLPGLYGGTVTGGQRIPDGANGFSTRFMWRAEGRGEVYAYLPGSEEHGTSLGRGAWTFATGRWQCVEQRVHLNTPGTADGEVHVWLDGQPVLSQTGLEFRTTDALAIDGVWFSTFFGGGDASWSTPRDQEVWFRDLRVSRPGPSG